MRGDIRQDISLLCDDGNELVFESIAMHQRMMHLFAQYAVISPTDIETGSSSYPSDDNELRVRQTLREVTAPSRAKV